MSDTIRIDPEFRDLIPPPTAEERAELEASIKAHGCRDPLATWADPAGGVVLIDGHTRYEICERLGVGFRTASVQRLGDRDGVKAWIIRNQFARRNLTAVQRAELALKLKPLLEAKAAERERAGKAPDPSANLREGRAGRTDEQVAKEAGLSAGTIRKVEKVIDQAAPEVADMARRGEVSVDAAAQVAKLPKPEQKKLAEQGPKAVKEAAKQQREKSKPQATVEAAPADAAPLDAVGVAVPEPLRPAFAMAQQARAWMRELSNLKSPVAKAVDGDLLAVQTQQFDHHVGEARSLLKFGLAHAVCPLCGGTKACDPRVGCHARGWMTEPEWSRTSEPTKAKHLANVARAGGRAA